MSHKTLLLQCALFGLLLISACKKDASEKSTLIGKVMLINSDTPVDRALVRFIRTESNGLLNPVSYYIQQEIITGPDGTFIIPDTTTADRIQAWGLDSIYGGDPSVEVYLSNFLANGGMPKLYLKPPAWLKIKAVDVEPLNPEIIAYYVDTANTFLSFSSQPFLNQFITFKTYGNVPLNVTGHVATNDGNLNSFLLPLDPINAFDTTEYIFEY